MPRIARDDRGDSRAGVAANAMVAAASGQRFAAGEAAIARLRVPGAASLVTRLRSPRHPPRRARLTSAASALATCWVHDRRLRLDWHPARRA